MISRNEQAERNPLRLFDLISHVSHGCIGWEPSVYLTMSGRLSCKGTRVTVTVYVLVVVPS